MDDLLPHAWKGLPRQLFAGGVDCSSNLSAVEVQRFSKHSERTVRNWQSA